MIKTNEEFEKKLKNIIEFSEQRFIEAVSQGSTTLLCDGEENSYTEDEIIRSVK